jgi:hypothetical protein
MKVPQITMKDWMEAEAKVMAERGPDPLPDGAMTSLVYAEERKCSASKARKILKDMAAMGLARRVRYGGNGYYYLLEKKKLNGK